jgi:hypothetical protein
MGKVNTYAFTQEETLAIMGMALALMAVSACDGGESPPDTLPDAPPDASSVDLDAACRAPEGAAITLDSSQVAEHLAGRWWMCGGAAEFYGNVEFTQDLRFYMLTVVNGEFVRNLGPRTSGTYSVDESPQGISFSIHQRYQDGTGATYPLVGTIMENPRMLQLGGGRYVAIP